MGYYYVAQVCLNGHIITTRLNISPMLSKKFCQKCGEPTISSCKHCGTNIPGEYHVEGFIEIGSSYKAPSYCHNCGKPYPWTEKKIEAAKELIDITEGIEESDKEMLKSSIDDITTVNPRNEVASTKIKAILKKLGGATQEILISTLSSIAAETAKKTLGV